ncbi:MAG: hypothetical protein GY754_16140 [bacterium]|nr:hypothetical protein [bacterium]
MNGEALVQNVFNFFIIAIIMEASVMAIFSIIEKNFVENKAVEAARDILILILAFVLCSQVDMLNLFKGTKIKLPKLLYLVISSLVLARMTHLVREFLSRFKSNEVR